MQHPQSHHGHCRERNVSLVERRSTPGWMGAQEDPTSPPDRFNGKTPWKDYREHFEECRLANNWTDEQAAVFLAASLQGPALKVLSHKDGEGKKYSYQELVGLLKRRFGPGQQAENHLMELHHRKQGAKKSLQELGQAVR